MSVSKYISIWFSSVLSWEWEALWSAPVPTFLPTPCRRGLLFHVSSAGRLSTGTLGLSEPRVRVQSHSPIYVLLPAWPWPTCTFYF